MNTSRDDLEAMLARAAELERANTTLRERNAELEQQLAPKPPPSVDESEVNRALLARAIERERAEAEARALAEREEAELRTYAKANAIASVEQRKQARALVLTFAFIGTVTAGALTSLAGIAVTVAMAAVLLVIVDPRWARGE